MNISTMNVNEVIDAYLSHMFEEYLMMFDDRLLPTIRQAAEYMVNVRDNYILTDSPPDMVENRRRLTHVSPLNLYEHLLSVVKNRTMVACHVGGATGMSVNTGYVVITNDISDFYIADSHDNYFVTAFGEDVEVFTFHRSLVVPAMSKLAYNYHIANFMLTNTGSPTEIMLMVNGNTVMRDHLQDPIIINQNATELRAALETKPSDVSYTTHIVETNRFGWWFLRQIIDTISLDGNPVNSLLYPIVCSIDINSLVYWPFYARLADNSKWFTGAAGDSDKPASLYLTTNELFTYIDKWFVGSKKGQELIVEPYGINWHISENQ